MGASGAFSASVGVKQFSHDIVQGKKRRFTLNSYCLKYVVAYDEGLLNLPDPEPNFCAQAKTLPSLVVENSTTATVVQGSPEQKAWFEFFTMFGTHYVHKVHLGGKMIHQVTLSQSAVTKIKQNGLDVKASVEAEFSEGVASGGVSASAETKSEKSSTNSQSSTDKEVKTFVFGGSPPAMDIASPSAFGVWADTVTDRYVYKLYIYIYVLTFYSANYV